MLEYFVRIAFIVKKVDLKVLKARRLYYIINVVRLIDVSELKKSESQIIINK